MQVTIELSANEQAQLEQAASEAHQEIAEFVRGNLKASLGQMIQKTERPEFRKALEWVLKEHHEVLLRLAK